MFVSELDNTVKTVEMPEGGGANDKEAEERWGPAAV